MPRYAVTVSATITGVAEYKTEVEADDEDEAREEAESEAESTIFGWKMKTNTLEVKSGTCTVDECEVLDGTEDTEEGTDDE